MKKKDNLKIYSKEHINRIAWLYWIQKKSQKEISEIYKINTVQVHRILNEAEKKGYVKIFVEGSFDICKEYEEKIKDKFNLTYIEVLPSTSHTKSTTINTLDPDPASIAYAGANYILKLIRDKKCRNIGWSTGSTNTLIANILPQINEEVNFIDTTGSLRSDLSFNPLLGLNTLSKKTKGKCYHLGAPYSFPSLNEKKKFFNLQFVKDIIKKENECQYIILGIGSLKGGGTSLFHRLQNHPYLLDKKTFNQLQKDGAVGESSGNFFNKNGKHFVYDQIVSKNFSLIKKKKTIAIAGGIDKASAIHSVLNNGCLYGLITDEEAAKIMLD